MVVTYYSLSYSRSNEMANNGCSLLLTVLHVWIEGPSACSKSKRYHHGATSNRYTVPTAFFCHVDGVMGFSMESRSRKCPILMSLKTA